MSAIHTPLRLMITASALAGFGLLACAEETPSDTDTSQGDARTDKDAGKNEDAGRASKDAGKGKDAGGGAAVPRGVPGEDCDSVVPGQCEDCGETLCSTKCEDGIWGECLPATSLVPDGGLAPRPGNNTGLPDGSTVQISDGSVSVKIGDASIAIQGMDCPMPFECSNKSMSLAAPAIMAISGGAPVCVGTTGLGAPPNCSTVADCTKAGFKQAACQPDPSGILGGSICLQICK